MLEAVDLVFAYGKRTVLDGISLRVAAGEVVSLLGPNGSGKSTLLKLLLGIQRPSRGEVRLDGVPLRRIPPRDYARKVAYVPQLHAALFPYAVLDVVLMGRLPHRALLSAYTKEDRRLALEALDWLGLAHLAQRPYTELSGGERQQVPPVP
ncbi:ABC transporter ATP-binding protein [Candidatus Methylocalor cossyra]|uniref:ABC transporter domain-containing protein n=1 Tax=Candidatus Methylocalor cossyra TaxID=3108543 RepID=A0ABM9NE02_9GAMM